MSRVLKARVCLRFPLIPNAPFSCDPTLLISGKLLLYQAQGKQFVAYYLLNFLPLLSSINLAAHLPTSR